MIVSSIIALLESKTAITDLVANRIYANRIPQAMSTYPCILIRTVSVVPNPTFDGASRHDYEFIDIHVKARALSECDAIAKIIRTQIEDTVGTYDGVDIVGISFQQSGADDYNDTLELKERQIEFKIHYKR